MTEPDTPTIELTGTVSQDELDNAAILFIKEPLDETLSVALITWLRTRSKANGTQVPLLVKAEDETAVWEVITSDEYKEHLASMGYVKQ